MNKSTSGNPLQLKPLDRALQFVAIVLTVFVAGVMLFSAIEHLGNPYAFLLSVLRYALVSDDLAQWVAIVLPAFQFALAITMLSFQAPRATSIAAASLVLFFTILQASALLRELDISCGCFGSFSESLSWWTVGRNVVLLSFCLFLCFRAFRNSTEKLQPKLELS